MFHHTVKLGSALEKAGFEIAKSIKDEKSVVLPRYGLVGAGVLFTRPENRERVSEACLAAKGVDFAVYPSQGEENRIISLVSKRGKARIFRNENSYRYEPIEGDPLELEPIIR